jgi:DNA-binding response OmpR family regulator
LAQFLPLERPIRRIARQQQETSVAHSRKVLIVEDEELLAENLMTHLQRCGWEVRIACDGKSALIAAREFLPEVVLLDYHLPDMNGFQVLDAIRAANHSCSCVLMTGHPTDTVMADAGSRGAVPILTKPFSMAGLVSRLLAAT